MIGKNWQYYILDEQGRSYYVQNGTVQVSNIPTPLQYTPDGWQKALIGWERNWTYYGINRNFTNPLAYVRDGAMIMRHIFYNGNIESKAFLLIQKKTLHLSISEYSYVYEYYYKGENDFSTYKQVDISGGYKVTTAIMEGGFSKYLKANNNTTYEIPCNNTANNYVKVRMDGFDFNNKMNFVIPDFDQSLYRRFTIPLAFLNEEGDSFGIYKSNQNFVEVPDNDADEIIFAQTSEDFFFSTIVNTTITITGTIYFEHVGVANYNSIYFKTSLGGTISLLTDQLLALDEKYLLNFSVTIPMLANEKLFLIFKGTNADPDAPRTIFFQSNFYVNTVTRITETICIARRPKDLFQELTDSLITGYTANSTVLDAKKNIVVTSGKAIRGFDDAVIKTTFDNFFKTHSILHCAGLEYNDNPNVKTVEIESIQKYFDATDPIPLGKIRNAKFEVFKDQVFNLLNIGYANQNYDSVNGLREFNTTQQYSTPITRIVKTLDMIMPYRADSYGIEILRKDYLNLDTTDSSSDDDVFLLNIDDEPDADGIYNLRRVTYDSITGVNSDVYNIEDLTPKRLLLKNGPLLRSLLSGFDADKLIFQTTDKNPALSTTKDGITITEAYDQDIYLLDAALFKMITIESEPEAYKGLIDLLNANSNRCFSIDYNNNIYKGFNLKIGIAPNDNETQTFKLLSTADNDLTKLING